MKWVKAHTGILDNDAFELLSKDARDTFLYALLIAGKQDQDGALAIRAIGPMTAAQVAKYTRIPIRRQQKALDELKRVGSFFYQREDGAYAISLWESKVSESSTKRTRTWRERHGNVTGTSREQNGDALEEEVEEEVDKSPNGLRKANARPKPKTEPSAEDLASWAILRAAVKVVWEHNRPAYTQDDWRKRNKDAALKLAESGHDPETVADVLTAMYTHPKARDTYGQSTKLMVVVENWSRLSDLLNDNASQSELRERLVRGEFLPVV